jgi:hypothetical protein
MQERTFYRESWGHLHFAQQFGCAMRGTGRELRRSIKFDAADDKQSHTSESQSDEPRTPSELKVVANNEQVYFLHSNEDSLFERS